MCDSNDVLQSTYHSASTMTKTLYEYGEGDMGQGIRKLMEERSKRSYTKGLLSGTLITATAGIIILIVHKCKKVARLKELHRVTSILSYKSNTDRKEKNMAKYRVKFNGELEDEVFDTPEAAEDYALYLSSCAKEGAETLNLSNPGDYDEDDYDDDYEIVEIED